MAPDPELHFRIQEPSASHIKSLHNIQGFKWLLLCNLKQKNSRQHIVAAQVKQMHQ